MNIRKVIYSTHVNDFSFQGIDQSNPTEIPSSSYVCNNTFGESLYLFKNTGGVQEEWTNIDITQWNTLHTYIKHKLNKYISHSSTYFSKTIKVSVACHKAEDLISRIKKKNFNRNDIKIWCYNNIDCYTWLVFIDLIFLLLNDFSVYFLVILLCSKNNNEYKHPLYFPYSWYHSRPFATRVENT